MPSGGTITISATNQIVRLNEVPELKMGRYVCISIHDEGKGIPPMLLSKIFDPFFTTKETGSGLGLAMCHSIIRKHNGAIVVNSVEGIGTTFVLYLPIAKKTIAKKVDTELLTIPLQGKILVMDDETITRDVAKNLLKRLGFEVHCTKNGEDAIKLFKEEYDSGKKFELVLLDLTIPGGINGTLTMAEIRKIDPDTIGIVSSGYADSPVLSKPELYGFAAKIEKPYKKAELYRTLRNVLSKRVTAWLFDPHTVRHEVSLEN
jgi:CheY-like chemotaxis protein